MVAIEKTKRGVSKAKTKGDDKILQSILTLALSTITMDGRGRHVQIEEIIIHLIGLATGVDEDERARRRQRKEEIEEGTILLILIDPDDLPPEGVSGGGESRGRQTPRSLTFCSMFL